MSEEPIGEPREEHRALFAPGIDPEKLDVRLSVGPKEISTERTARLRMEEDEARHRRWRETITHLVTLTTFVLGLVAIGTACLVLLFRPGTSAPLQQWAASGLSAILAGATGYLAGKSRG